MKLEVGKYYKGQNGDKWKCVHESSDSNQFFNMLCVLIDNSLRINYYFSKDGRYESEPEPYDLISEWVEPVEHEVEVHFYKQELNGRVLARDSGASLTGWKIIAKVKVKFTEGEGL